MVTVYTKDNCNQCRATKTKLGLLKIPYVEINIEHDAEARAQLLAQGWKQMPVVKHETTSWAGFRPDRIENLKYIL